MAVLQMRKLTICALKKDRKAVLELLQAAGAVEITSETEENLGLVKEDPAFARSDTTSFRQTFERNAASAEQALELLQEYAPEKKSMFSALEGKQSADAKRLKETEENLEHILERAKEIIELNRTIAEQKASIVKLNAQIESLVPWKTLDIPLKGMTTACTAVLTGSINGTVSLEELYRTAAEKAPDIEGLDIQVIGTERDQTCIAVTCLKKDAGKLEETLRTIGFARPSQMLSEVPADYMEELKRQIETIETEIEASKQKLKSYETDRDDFKLAADYCRIRAERYEVLGTLYQSEQTFLITGYIAERDVDRLREKLTGRFELDFETKTIPEDEDAPVLLKNNAFAASAEGVVASFGLPAKGELDPTSIMAVCYVFLFGLMLSDAAYGLMVFLACFIALKKFPKMGENLQKSLRLFMYCGLSTLFWGVLFGGYFGDAVNVISRTFFGHEVTIPALWFVPLNDPMKMLLYSMLFGVIHLYLGLGIKGYMCIRDKQYTAFICDVVFWFMMLTGLILILVPTELFGSIAQMQIVFPDAVNTAAKWLAAGGALGILLMSGRNSKNPLLRVALGAYDLYNITGWLSDVLSYSRLLALGLATGVIASVINQMGSMAGNGIFGAVVFAAVFCFGHLFNLAINLLGAYVHTCRLQYVEFFGKFYEGGGKAFAPFKQNTKYVEIKED